jgi:hypothetical protein
MTSPVPSKSSGINPPLQPKPKDTGLKIGNYETKELSLPLFVFRVDANYPHHATAVDDLAFVANLFYRCSYFHVA